MIEKFIEQKSEYERFRIKILKLIEDLLQTSEIKIHHITSRLKKQDSLLKKIETKVDKYNQLSDITDIVGIRIITHLEKEVDEIAEIIETEFDIDIANSIDKRKLEVDKFGYKSLHYIISLDSKRNSLKEYFDLKDFKAEIQIRTILQHSWAEIQHDLGYKSEISLPDEIKRNFFRLAALLETADKEFERIKIQIQNYKSDVNTKLFKLNTTIDLNLTTLIAFTSKSKVIKKIANEIISGTKVRLTNNNGDYDYIILTFRLNQINTIQELDITLQKRKKEIINYYKLKIKKESELVSIPFSIVYHALAQLILLENNNFVLSKLKKMNIDEINELLKYLRDLQNTEANYI